VTDPATPITDTGSEASHVSWSRDLSGVRTRVTVEGGGSTALVTVPSGEEVIPVADASWYDPAGGDVTSGPQRIHYISTFAGGTGSQVGVAVTPTNAPLATRRAVAGMSAGNYSWVQTFTTAAGETMPSPISTVVTMGTAVPQPSAPSVTKEFGGNLTASGVYKWKYAYLTALGETLASTESSALTMSGDPSAPSAIGTASFNNSGTGYDTGGVHFNYKFTFVNGSVETTGSPASNEFGVSIGEGSKLARSGNSSPPAGFDRKFYRSNATGGPWKAMPGSSDGFSSNDATFYYDNIPDASLGTTIPTSSTALYRSAILNVVASSDALVTNIRVYRTAAGGSTFKKVADISNSTGTYTDTLADGSLGSTELGAATALYFAADLVISQGPTGVTGRKVYRTVANGSTYKLQSTIANNSTTAITDTTADGSLGANAPSTDTSGLTSTAGEVQAGSTTMKVTSLTPFLSTQAYASGNGGWALVAGQYIKYTDLGGLTLTGIPSSGVGALTTTVRYGTPIVSMPLIVRIAASGDGSIQYPITAGDDVNLLVTVNDTAAQTALGLAVGGDGVVEDYLQDRRLSATEAVARAQAQLTLVKDPLVTVTYETFLRDHRAGRDVTFTSTLLALAGTFKIQSVTMTEFDGAQRTWPRRQVTATSRRFSYEALLRQARN